MIKLINCKCRIFYVFLSNIELRRFANMGAGYVDEPAPFNVSLRTALLALSDAAV